MMWGPQNYVAMTHEPSGMAVKADYTRSNFRCLQTCKAMLRGKLWSLEHGADIEPPTEAQRAIADAVLARIASRGSA